MLEQLKDTQQTKCRNSFITKNPTIAKKELSSFPSAIPNLEASFLWIGWPVTSSSIQRRKFSAGTCPTLCLEFLGKNMMLFWLIFWRRRGRNSTLIRGCYLDSMPTKCCFLCNCSSKRRVFQPTTSSFSSQLSKHRSWGNLPTIVLLTSTVSYKNTPEHSATHFFPSIPRKKRDAYRRWSQLTFRNKTTTPLHWR